VSYFYCGADCEVSPRLWLLDALRLIGIRARPSVSGMAGTEKLRALKRGMRGEDVIGWHRFLMKLRRRPEVGGSFPAITVDGIFGFESARATMSFQTRFGLGSDGVVGQLTWAKAQTMGLNPVPFTGHVPTDSATPGDPVQVPMVPQAASAPSPPPPPPPAGSTRAQSWRRLRAEGWAGNGALQAGLTGSHAVFQSVAGGSGDYLYDEYQVEIGRMPDGVTPEEFLQEMEKDLNGTVKDSDFDRINQFKRRASGALRVAKSSISTSWARSTDR
jgi:Putative peptidoglycan binding domain